MIVAILLLAACMGVWLLAKLTLGRGVSEARWPLMAQPLLDAREQTLYRRLVELYPDHVVLTRVALSQLIAVRHGTLNGRAVRRRFSQLVADFVLCTRNFAVVAVIELDDDDATYAYRAFAEARKTIAVTSAGLRLVRIGVGTLPDSAELRRLVEAPESALDEASRKTFGAAVVPARLSARVPARPKLVAAAAAALALMIFGGRFFNSPERPAPPAPSVAAAPSRVTPALAAVPAQTVISLAEIPVDDTAEQARLAQAAARKTAAASHAAAELERRKERAWAQFYKPDDYCEHPTEWADQVECGNRYMRAKKAFEAQWRAHANGSLTYQSLGALSPGSRAHHDPGAAAPPAAE